MKMEDLDETGQWEAYEVQRMVLRERCSFCGKDRDEHEECGFDFDEHFKDTPIPIED